MGDAKDKACASLSPSDSENSWTAALQALCPPLSPGVCSNPCPLSEWGLTGLILPFKGLSKVFSSTLWKHQFCAQPSLWANSHIHTWLLEKSVFTRQNFVSKVMSLLSNTLSRFLIAFLPRSKCLSILWLQLLFTIILEPKKRKSASFHFSTFYLTQSDETG